MCGLTKPPDGLFTVFAGLFFAEFFAFSCFAGLLDLSGIIPISVIRHRFCLQPNALQLEVPDRVRFACNRLQTAGRKE